MDIISLHSLFKKMSTYSKNEKFFNLKSRVFEDNFRTLKRKDPILNIPKQDFYNKILTDLDKSVDKINHFKLFIVFLKANSTLGFTNFVPHASQRAVFIRYYKKGVAISSIPRFYSS